jgi:AcrR family transcriptional regulator
LWVARFLMARTVGSSGPKTLAAIRQAGLDLIYRHGYEAMSLRRLAAEVGLREGSLYNHIASKQDLLFSLVDDHMDRLLAAMTEAMTGTEGGEARLRAFVTFHLTYHMQRQAEVFVINSELRSLDEAGLKTIVAKRDAYEEALVAILRTGNQEGLFGCPDCRIAAKAIIAMLTGVCTWFKPDGRLTIDQIVPLYIRLVMDGVRGTAD